jgi:hypothetical protein
MAVLVALGYYIIVLWFAWQFLQVFRHIGSTLERISIAYRDGMNTPRNPAELPPGH